MIDLIGFLLPPAIDLINKRIEDSIKRFWISVAICIVVGIVVHFLINGGFAGFDALAKDILAIFGSSQITYYGVYKNSKAQIAIRKEGI